MILICSIPFRLGKKVTMVVSKKYFFVFILSFYYSFVIQENLLRKQREAIRKFQPEQAEFLQKRNEL